MRRRTALLAPLPLLAGHAWSNGSIEPTDAEPVQKLATAWRLTGATAPDTGDRVGVIEIDWAAARVRVLAETAVPTRAHGLLPLPDGGFMAVATRPGHWLLRCDASGQVQRRLDTTADDPQRTFVVVRFAALDDKTTRVTLHHTGWGDGGQWDQAYAYFDKAWGSVLGNLKKRFESGPYDWTEWLKQLEAWRAEAAKKSAAPK